MNLNLVMNSSGSVAYELGLWRTAAGLGDDDDYWREETTGVGGESESSYEDTRRRA